MALAALAKSCNLSIVLLAPARQRTAAAVPAAATAAATAATA
ncbi:hypothetical protein B2J93_5347 [Marssonina coronariae]|uniref:Uncharacterized protein n=1 Tax=Diplocarpon coronariae TaxID=2795749 RepID=A0A218ZH38_9HELO|nr:hypothetical protein B2J93_5347 [Marssonina coronariae]